MKAFLRKLSLSVSRGPGSWLTLLLLLAVLVPSASLLWFMSRAAQNERLALRQKLTEAYRGRLMIARLALESGWERRAMALDAEAETIPPPALFARWVRDGSADAVVCFDAAGGVVYPNALSPPKAEASTDGLAEARRLESSDLAAAAAAYAALAAAATNTGAAALALQAQARCLVQAGNRDAAVSVLTGPLAEERFRQAVDGQGRLIVPNAELMAVELLQDSQPDQARDLSARLQKRLLDYDSVLPAPQRRFLMRELQRLSPGGAIVRMLAAEDLAAAYVEARGTNSPEAGLRASPLPGVWQFASNKGRSVTLRWTTNLLARLRIASDELPTDVRMDCVAPGQDTENALISLPAGPPLQGWRLTLSLKDQDSFDNAAREQVTSYLWMGALIVGTVVILAALALGMMRRQAALTQLRNDLVANVTHELKTPLSSMRLLVETLLNAPQIHEQTAREYLDLIAKENLRLSRLIDNFLTFSRIERNKYTFDFKAAPAAAIAEGAAAAVRERFSAAGCRFEVRIAPNLPSVLADADALVTALVNLLDNAFKYSGETKEILLTAGAENSSVRFVVQDNGIGLSPRDRKRIFKRFYQVNQHLSPTGGGCGLGLSIVKHIVEAHGGRVLVESEPGRGSKFTIEMPAPRLEHLKSETRNSKSE